MKTGLTVVLVPLSCLVLGAGAALAEFPEGVPDTVQVDMGGTFASLDTNLGVIPSDGGVGVVANLEEVMNLDTSQSAWRIDGNWRFTKRQHLDFGYVNYDRSGSRESRETFTWGDYTFNKGNTMDGSFDSSFIYAAYRYDILQDPHVRISGSAGVSYVDLSASMSGTGTVGTPDGPRTGTFTADASMSVPVPLFGLQLDWAMAKKWELMWYGRFMFVNQSFEGSVYDSTLRVKWWFLKNVGAGLGYDRQDITIRSYEKDDKDLKGNYNIAGWSAFLSLAF